MPCHHDRSIEYYIHDSVVLIPNKCPSHFLKNVGIIKPFETVSTSMSLADTGELLILLNPPAYSNIPGTCISF